MSSSGRKKRAAEEESKGKTGVLASVQGGDGAVVCPLQENDYLQECLEVVQQEFMIFNRER